MFNNLIESSSHRSELKRRGSFFLFTTGTYAVLFIVTGIASIYAYDARLEDQSLEVVTMMSPVDFPAPTVTTARPSSSPRSTGHANQVFDVRRKPTAAVDQPTLMPEKISNSPNPDLPVRRSVAYMGGPDDSNASLPGENTGRGRRPGSPAIKIVEVITPPPDPGPRPTPKIIKSPRILNSEALSLPKPPFPQIAKVMGVQGRVSVQVLIDETGKVVSARVIDGPPLLRQVSERAAYQARFSPTMLGDQAVKVSGVITYNFLLQ